MAAKQARLANRSGLLVGAVFRGHQCCGLKQGNCPNTIIRVWRRLSEASEGVYDYGEDN